MHIFKAPPSCMCTRPLPGQPEVITQASLQGTKNAWYVCKIGALGKKCCLNPDNRIRNGFYEGENYMSSPQFM
jgi:hypothetical protein